MAKLSGLLGLKLLAVIENLIRVTQYSIDNPHLPSTILRVLILEARIVTQTLKLIKRKC